MSPSTLKLLRGNKLAEGKSAGDRADRRNSGGEEDVGPDSAVPSAAADSRGCVDQPDARRRADGIDSKHKGGDRCRDGSA